MVWGKLGSTTLGSAGDTITVSSLTNNKFLQVLGYIESATAWVTNYWRFNSDSGSNYADRNQFNGGTDGTHISASYLDNGAIDPSRQSFEVIYVINQSTEEKLSITHKVENNDGIGAGNAPRRNECVGKWANTSDAISSVSSVNTNSGSSNYDTGSNVSVLGSEGQTPTSATILDGLIFEETDTNKHYIYDSSTDTWTEI